MIKNVFMKSVAVVSAVAVVMAPAVSVAAYDDVTEPVNQSGEYGNVVVVLDEGSYGDAAVKAQNGTDITVHGDVSASGDISETQTSFGVDGISAYGGNVTVTGNVTSNNIGVRAYDGYVTDSEDGGSTVTVGGNVESTATEGWNTPAIEVIGKNSIVEVGKDAISAIDKTVVVRGGEADIKGDVINNESREYHESTGIEVAEGGKVTVGGDVIVPNGVGIKVNDGNTYSPDSNIEKGGSVTVNGNVIANGAAIKAGTGADIHVKGNVQAFLGQGISITDNANITVDGNVNGIIYVDVNGATAPGSVKVKGALNCDHAAIFVGYDDTGFSSAEEMIALLPDISVYQINVNNPYLRYISTNDLIGFEKGNAIKQYYADNINYYYHYGDNVTILNPTATGTVKRNQNISVAVPEGYEVVADNCVVYKNDNGTYTVTLTDMKGGIDIQAVIKAVQEATGADIEDIKVVTEQPASENSTPIASVIVAKADVTTNTPAAAPIVEGAKAPSKVVTFDIWGMSSEQFKEVVTEAISTTTAGTSLRIEIPRVATFDRSIMETLAANPTIDVEVIFTYGGQKLRVVIPAGYDVMSLLDDNGYCGFLRLAYFLGSQVIE